MKLSTGSTVVFVAAALNSTTILSSDKTKYIRVLIVPVHRFLQNQPGNISSLIFLDRDDESLSFGHNCLQFVHSGRGFLSSFIAWLAKNQGHLKADLIFRGYSGDIILNSETVGER